MQFNRFFLLVLVALVPAIQGLALVPSSMAFGRLAALKPIGRPRASPSPTVTLNARTIQSDDKPLPISDNYVFGNEDDSNVQAMRSEVVDLVYQRSLERLDGFNNQLE